MHRHAALLLGLLALVSPACSSPVTERRVTRDEARAVLAAHCGSCHNTDGLPTTLPAALAVYDLGEPEWAVRMSAAQLDNAVWRLGEPLAPDGRPNDATSAERNRLERYVALEKAARAAAPACPPDDVLEAIHAAAYHDDHDDRTHLGLRKATPAGRPMKRRPDGEAKVVHLPRVGGLHHRYEWRAAA